MHTPGSKVSITYERDKKLHTVDMTLKKLEQSEAGNGTSLLEGLELAELNDDARRYYHIPQNVEGILITKVIEESEAAEQGLREGDVIIQVEQWTFDTMDDFKDLLKKYQGKYKRVYISRNGRVFIIALK